jgi:hypothetical protein
MASLFNRRALIGMKTLTLVPVCVQCLLLSTFICCAPAFAASLSFTVNTSKPVVVTGLPRIALDVGGIMRYATYAAGSGTTALTFSYAVQPGDFDANGIEIVSPLELNGGSLADSVGNPVSVLDFTLPDTSGIKVQTYTAGFTTSPITSANANAVSFAIAQAPAGASFSYTITSSGGLGSVTGSGIIGGSSHTVSSVDVSNLAAGTLTLSVTVSTAAGGTGAAKTASATPTLTSDLDSLPTGAASYSTRRMWSSYSGSILRVRRSSDNTEQDIGATIGGGLDTTALSAFCAAASCFVRTWYDQSGNGRHATQATTNLQPRLVNAGTIDTFNGMPAPLFNGSNTALTTVSLLPASSSVWTTHLINVLGNGATGRGRVWGLTTNPSMAANLVGDDFFGTVGILSTSTTVSPRIVSFFIGATSSAWINGALVGTQSSPVGWTGGENLTIGNIGNLSRAYNGHLQTIYIGLGSYPAADRQAIERWLGALSGITVP